ncbi:MAG: PKD domain-containing protein [Bacteroidales bacterium]|nr:PKD domain-containing protein [Bacteroidales bacterium]MBN2699637.1 PKD domain-containing protein [Bacteroidales bacterium]
MKCLKNSLLQFALLMGAVFTGANGQVIADFETPSSAPPLYSDIVAKVVENPDKTGINPSDSVGYYLKQEGNWHWVKLDFPDTMKFRYNNRLSFKLRTSVQGRIYAKFYLGSETVIENWCPDWNFRPLPFTWTECSMDITGAMGKQFTQLHLAACVDNSFEAEVWFDDVKLSNPNAGDGTPIPLFKANPLRTIPGEETIFDASASYDYDGDIVDYRWDFGDGTRGSGMVTGHVYTVDSVYLVGLIITDNDGKSDSAAMHLFVVPPDGTPSAPLFTTPGPATNEKVEAIFHLAGNYSNNYDPGEVMINAAITCPDGSVYEIPCFYYEEVDYTGDEWVLTGDLQCWMLRTSSSQAGMHSLRLALTDSAGTRETRDFRFEVFPGTARGVIRRDTANGQYYRHSTGEPFFPLGINIGWDDTGDYTQIISNLSDAGANIFRYWHAAFNRQALEWSDNYFYDGLGQYSQKAAAMSDSLLDLCDKKEMTMQLVIFQHGMFSENVDSNWDSNPYNSANGGFIDRAEAFFYNEACKIHARKLLRYLVARYAYSRNLFAWEFFNEVQFTGYHNQQSEAWWPGVVGWHGEMSRYIASIDPFDHIQTTSAATGQLASLDTIEALDNLQYHIYENEGTLLQSQAALDSRFTNELCHTSVINGEYGTDINADMPFDLQRNEIWSSIMTTVPRYMWIWDHYLQSSWAELFRMPSEYLSGEDMATRTGLHSTNPVPVHPSLSLSSCGLSSDSAFFGYVYDPAGGNDISGTTLEMEGFPVANYSVTYFFPLSGEVLQIDSIPVIYGSLTLEVPAFSKAFAYKVRIHSPYTLPLSNPGNDTIISIGNPVRLSGSLSRSPGSGTLTYLWKLIEKPLASILELTGTTGMEIEFTPDKAGLYQLSLEVNDGTYTSEPGFVTVTVSTPPVAIAGRDTSVSITENYLRIDGSASYDPDGEAISYFWQLLSWPEESAGIIYAGDTREVILKVDAEGDFVLSLTVHDQISSSSPDTVVATVTGTGPLSCVPQHEQKFHLYPNPASGCFMVVAQENEVIRSVEIFNTEGKRLRVIHCGMDKDGWPSVTVKKLEQYSGQVLVKVKGRRSMDCFSVILIR